MAAPALAVAASARDEPGSLAKRYAQDGAVCVRGLIDRASIQNLTNCFARLKQHGQDLSGYYGDTESGRPGAGRGQTIVCNDCWRIDPPFLAYLRESPILHWAAGVLGSDRLRILEDLLIYKSAGAEQPTPWHQDEPQWPVFGRQMVSAWFCLDPVTRATGALRFALGTHRGPLYRPTVPPERQADAAADERWFDGGDLPSIEDHPDRFQVASVDCAPGDVVFFHPRTLHAALGSAPDYARRTFSIRLLGDDVRWRVKRSVFHEWMKDIRIAEGAELAHERFPLLRRGRSGAGGQ